jgi:hypothetical protein
MLHQIEKGKKPGYIELILVSSSLLCPSLLKLSLETSDSFKVNLFTEDPSCISFFKSLRPMTKLFLQSYKPSNDYSMIKRNLPSLFNPEKIALSDSKLKFILELTFPLSTFYLEFGGNSLEVPSSASLSSINLESLYEVKEVAKEAGVYEKYLNLREILEKVKTVQAGVFSCWAVVVDCCDSYHPKPDNPADSLVIYKITDQSIFPDHVTLNVFHKDPREVPKVENYGDVILLNSVTFKEFKGKLQGVFAAGVKNTSFFLFNINSTDPAPYASYRSLFLKESDSEEQLRKVADWVKNAFELASPTFLRNVPLRFAEIETDKESDVIARVIGIYNLGLGPAEPFMILFAEGEKAYEMTLPGEKRKLVQCLKSGDTVRIRSLVKKGASIRPTDYTEILKIPFKRLRVEEQGSEKSVDQQLRPFFTKIEEKEVSNYDRKMLKFPEASFEQIQDLEVDMIVRVRAHVLHFQPGIHSKLTLWDGTSDENTFEVFVDQDDLFEFLNGNSVEGINNKVSGWNKVFSAAVKKTSEGLRVVHSRLLAS